MTVVNPVLTATISGSNADLIADTARLYLRTGMTVADVTYGKGGFWRKTDLSGVTFLPSDINTGVDFRALPYADGFIDVLVLDPPYQHNAGHPQNDATYNNWVTTPNMSHAAIMELYAAGMVEAWRVLRPGGQCWVKCQDEVVNRRQHWSHVEIKEHAERLEFEPVDLRLLVRKTGPNPGRWKIQEHAWRNHSFLWIFEKPRRVGRSSRQ